MHFNPSIRAHGENSKLGADGSLPRLSVALLTPYRWLHCVLTHGPCRVLTHLYSSPLHACLENLMPRVMFDGLPKALNLVGRSLQDLVDRLGAGVVEEPTRDAQLRVLDNRLRKDLGHRLHLLALFVLQTGLVRDLDELRLADVHRLNIPIAVLLKLRVP